jgi:hypothetical protein
LLSHATGRFGLVVRYTATLGILLELVLAGIPTAILLLLGNPAAAMGVGVVVAVLVAWLYWRVIASIIRRERRYHSEWPRRLRLARFAAANGLRYLPEPATPTVLPVVLDDFGLDQQFFDVFTGPDFIVGSYRTSLRASRVLAPNGWGFLQVRLDQAIPHLLLTPKQTRGLRSRMFVAVRGDQVLELEGDFGKHFTLYAPVGYERDALYVITPDLMALFIDRAPGSFVEIRGNVLSVVFPGPLDPETSQAWERYAELLGTIGRKGGRQTARYNDTRSPRRGVVASHGRLLKAGIPVGTVIAVIYISLQIYRWVHGF